MTAEKSKTTAGFPAGVLPKAVFVVRQPICRCAQVLAEVREAGLRIDDFDATRDLVRHPPTPSRGFAADLAWARDAAAQVGAATVAWDATSHDGITACYKQIEMAASHRKQSRKPY